MSFLNCSFKNCRQDSRIPVIIFDMHALISCTCIQQKSNCISAHFFQIVKRFYWVSCLRICCNTILLTRCDMKILANFSISFESRFLYSIRSPISQGENLKTVWNCPFGISVQASSSPIESVTAVSPLTSTSLETVLEVRD